jgi:hypothetical protein
LDVSTTQIGVECLAGFTERIRSGRLIVHLTRERHQGTDLIALRLDVFGDRQLPAHCFDPAAQDHHSLGLTVQKGRNGGLEVLDNDLNLLTDAVRMEIVKQVNEQRPHASRPSYATSTEVPRSLETHWSTLSSARGQRLGGGPIGKRNGNYRTGRYTQEILRAVTLVKAVARLVRKLDLP